MRLTECLPFRLLMNRATIPACLVAAAVLLVAPSAFAVCGDGTIDGSEQCDDGTQNGTTNSCCTSSCTFAPKSPDVIVGDLVGVINTYTSVGGISAYAIGTTSCNLGSCWLNWFSSIPEHPVIGQNMFRLKSGRFEQIGQAWLKHGFTALQGTVCSSSCVPAPNGTHLGVNCSDPYSASLNGSQSGMGPKVDVNAFTGVYPYPDSRINATGNSIFKRLQVHNTDLDPTLNAGALYFVEGQYVSHDDSTAKMQSNNASYRPITVTATTSTTVPYTIALTGSTQRQKAGIQAWKVADPSVTETIVSVPNDGIMYLSAKATSLGGGVYHYEYALQNLASHRSGQSFSVPIPAGAVITNVGFHDVDYHSGEPFDGTDWTSTVGGGFVSWSTQTYAQNVNANALRWGTLYNFRFDANIAPATSPVTIGLFRPGDPGSVSISTVTPSACTATEALCGNGLDDDCDGRTDCTDTDCCTNAACAASDVDGDHYAAVCDCNDANPSVYPGAPQLCDGLNNNCSDPAWPAVPANEADADGDSVRICAGDCDDTKPSVYPGAPQLCDGINNDCNAPGWPAVPANEADADGDSVRICAGDCDDTKPSVYPSAPQLCDGINNDCADPAWPAMPANEADADADTFRICAGDCDDVGSSIYPGAPQLCDGLNNDCSDPAWPAVPANEADADTDGVRVCAGDCDDANASVWATPGEATALMLSHAAGVTALSWSAPANPGCTSLRYDTIRTLLPSDFVSAADCIETDGTDTTTPDATTPLEGTVFCYLIRAEDDCPAGQGSLGTSSDGAPRTGRSCP